MKFPFSKKVHTPAPIPVVVSTQTDTCLSDKYEVLEFENKYLKTDCDNWTKRYYDTLESETFLRKRCKMLFMVATTLFISTSALCYLKIND